MPQQSCLICASDEGIFLDIYSNNNYRDNIETCLSLKTKKSDLPSTKICHKCAYELDQCSKFVKKYKKTQIENGMLYKKHGYCSLCMEPGKKGLIFDLVNENPLNNPQEKIHRLFNIDGNFTNLSICLDCRYNLDVLFDLKCILTDHSDYLKKVSSGEIKSPNMKKIKTNVVRRKTTAVKSSPTKVTKDTLSDMDSDTSSISENTSTRLRSNGSSSVSHNRQCEECRAKIPIGDDMFRYHTSGLTVCKQCWLKMDPSDGNYGKKRKISTKTKLCCVFLKDILTSSDNKPSTIEKDDNSDSIYTISDDSTIEESKLTPKKANTISKSKRKNNQNDFKPLKKPKNDVNLRKSTRTRASSVQIEEVERKFLRSSRAKSVEVVGVVGNRQLPEKKNSSETNKSKSRKKTNEISKLNLSSEKTNKKNISNRGRKRTRNKSNSSISSIEENKSSKTTKKMSKLSNRKVDSDSENSRPYTCNICHNDFDNRVEGLTHELTHSKSLEVVLKKVSITDSTDDKLKKNKTEKNDEVAGVTKDINNKEEVDQLNTKSVKESSVNKSFNKDDENEIHSEIQTADNTLKECEDDKTSNSENIETINDEKDDDNDEKRDNNDRKQNDGSNIIKSNSENEEKAANNDDNDDDDKDKMEKDSSKQDNSLVVVDVSSDNGNISQENHEKDDIDTHNNDTFNDSKVDDGTCESEEKPKEANDNVDKKSLEKNIETTSNIKGDDEISVDSEKCEENEEKKEAKEKIELITNNMDDNNPKKINDNNNDHDDDDSDKEEKEEKNKEDEKDEEKEKDEEEKEKSNKKEEEDGEEKERSEEDDNNEKFEDAKESLQCLHDKATNDSLENNKDKALLNNENKDEEQLDEEKPVENDKNSNCSEKNETKIISDVEDEGALIEQEMEKIKTHINNSKQVDQKDDELEIIKNSVELEKINNDNKSLNDLNVTNSENGEEP